MKKINVTLLLIAIFIFIYATLYFKKKNNTNTTKKNEMIQPFLLINVVEKDYFDDAHIPYSVHVDYDNIKEYLTSILQNNKHTPLIFYCTNYYCTSSDDAALTALKLGFTDVSVYKGGTAEWVQTAKNDPTITYNGKGTKEYLEIIILPKNISISDMYDEIIIEEKEKCKNFKIITIKELQKILYTV